MSRGKWRKGGGWQEGSEWQEVTENKKVKEFILRKWRRKLQEDWGVRSTTFRQRHRCSFLSLNCIIKSFLVLSTWQVLFSVLRMPMVNDPCCQPAGPALSGTEPWKQKDRRQATNSQCCQGLGSWPWQPVRNAHSHLPAANPFWPLSWKS